MMDTSKPPGLCTRAMIPRRPGKGPEEGAEAEMTRYDKI